MNKKISVIAIAIALCLVLPSLAGTLRNANAVTPPALSLQPVLVPSGEIGSSFTMRLHVDNVTNLWSWEVSLTWDPTYLNMTADPTEGSFLNNPNGTLFVFTPYKNTPGTLNIVSDTILANASKTGSGDLATFTFTIIAHGYNTTTIGFDLPILNDQYSNAITYSYTVGAVRNTLVGDVTGPLGVPDGVVNMRDIAVIARAFGTTPSSPNWNPNADLNLDNVVNMRDIALAARHFGQHL